MRVNMWELKGGVILYEVLQHLKGISCMIYVLSFQTETVTFKYQAEALELLSQAVDSCIEELEKMKSELD